MILFTVLAMLAPQFAHAVPRDATSPEGEALFHQTQPETPITSVNVAANSSEGVTLTLTPGRRYTFYVSGYWCPSSTTCPASTPNQADAGFETTNAWSTHFQSNGRGIIIDGANYGLPAEDLNFSPGHRYVMFVAAPVTGPTPGQVRVRIADGNYSNNSGSLKVDVTSQTKVAWNLTYSVDVGTSLPSPPDRTPEIGVDGRPYMSTQTVTNVAVPAITVPVNVPLIAEVQIEAQTTSDPNCARRIIFHVKLMGQEAPGSPRELACVPANIGPFPFGDSLRQYHPVGGSTSTTGTPPIDVCATFATATFGQWNNTDPNNPNLQPRPEGPNCVIPPPHSVYIGSSQINIPIPNPLPPGSKLQIEVKWKADTSKLFLLYRDLAGDEVWAPFGPQDAQWFQDNANDLDVNVVGTVLGPGGEAFFKVESKTQAPMPGTGQILEALFASKIRGS